MHFQGISGRFRVNFMETISIENQISYRLCTIRFPNFSIVKALGGGQSRDVGIFFQNLPFQGHFLRVKMFFPQKRGMRFEELFRDYYLKKFNQNRIGRTRDISAQSLQFSKMAIFSTFRGGWGVPQGGQLQSGFTK